MSVFKALSRANREIQLDSWTPVVIDTGTLLHIHEENVEDLVQPPDDMKSTAVKVFLENWCRSTIKGGFAIKVEEGASAFTFTDKKRACYTFLFQLVSEAVRFKLHWGGR